MFSRRIRKSDNFIQKVLNFLKTVMFREWLQLLKRKVIGYLDFKRREHKLTNNNFGN